MINLNSDLLKLVFEPDTQIENNDALSLQEATDIVKNYVVIRYPKAILVTIFGSTARSSNSAQSDIDVMVILEEANTTFREQVLVKGRMIQAFITNTFGAISRINNSKYSNEYFLSKAIVDSRLVAGNVQLLSVLVHLSYNSLKPLEGKEAINARQRSISRISNSIISLSKPVEKDEYTYLIEQLVSRFREYILIGSGRFGGGGVSDIKEYKAIMGDRAYDIAQIQSRAITSGNPSELCRRVWQLLCENGPASWVTPGPIIY